MTETMGEPIPLKRNPVSKKLRFEVFKRDGFTCQYCGSHPSDTVVLEIDHVLPVIEGGTNAIENLVTACFECNRGKRGVLLTVVPQSLEQKSEIIREREAQVRAYYQILAEQKERKDEELWTIAGIFVERFGDKEILRSRLASIRMFLGRLDFFEVQEAMEIAADRFYSKGRVFAYFCGICWQKIKRNAGEE